MNKEIKKSSIKYNLPGLGLVFGTAIGAGFGIIININMMPVTAGIGCLIGLLLGAIITSYDKNKKEKEE